MELNTPKPQRIVVTGGSGLIGSRLIALLSERGARVVRLVRRPTRPDANEIFWDPAAGRIDADALERADSVVHLAGESIAAGRWTRERRQVIRRSRVDGTRLLAKTLAELKTPPRTLVAASAIGFYGDRGNEALTEDSPGGVGFLADVCREWEVATEQARQTGIRVVNLRIGVVLCAAGGALVKMLTPFKLGLGGVIGSGQQYMSWIALDDLTVAIDHLIRAEEVSGPVNAVAPHPVTNREFTKTLGRVLRRPTVLPLPGFAVRLILGEMGQALLLSSTRVLSTKLRPSGFEFAYPELDVALRGILQPRAA